MKRLLAIAALALLATTTAHADYYEDPAGAETYGQIFIYHKNCAPLHYRILDAANAIGAPIAARDLAVAQNAALAAYNNNSAAFCESVRRKLGMGSSGMGGSDPTSTQDLRTKQTH